MAGAAGDHQTIGKRCKPIAGVKKTLETQRSSAVSLLEMTTMTTSFIAVTLLRWSL